MLYKISGECILCNKIYTVSARILIYSCNLSSPYGKLFRPYKRVDKCCDKITRASTAFAHKKKMVLLTSNEK